MSAIPAKSRNLVRERAHHRCERCLSPAPRGEWHHRRGRSVVDGHTHCPCNGVWLCRTCHSWAHTNPTEARKAGWIVSRWVAVPGTVPITRQLGTTWRNDCVGTAELVTSSERRKS
jgi:5-methylcytosine-specific restriction protein A